MMANNYASSKNLMFMYIYLVFFLIQAMFLLLHVANSKLTIHFLESANF